MFLQPTWSTVGANAPLPCIPERLARVPSVGVSPPACRRPGSVRRDPATVGDRQFLALAARSSNAGETTLRTRFNDWNRYDLFEMGR